MVDRLYFRFQLLGNRLKKKQTKKLRPKFGNCDLKKSSSEMPLKQTKITFFSPLEGATNEPESKKITDQTDPEKQNSDENNNTAPPTSTELSKKVVKRNFREKWLSMYPWLAYDSEKQ